MSHFSSTVSSRVISQRTQEDSGEESNIKVETNDEFGRATQRKDSSGVFASTASESPEKTKYKSQIFVSSWIEHHLRTGSQIFVSSWIEHHPRTGRFKDAYASSNSERNADEKWCSQECESVEVKEARTGGFQ